jgi:hypothetical protein
MPRPERLEPASEWRVVRVREREGTLELIVAPRTMQLLTAHD